jgi:hypothetical protein
LRAAVDAVAPAAPDAATLEGAVALVEEWIAAGATLVAAASGRIPHPGLTIYREWRQHAQAATFDDELATHNRQLAYFQEAVSTNWDDSALIFGPDTLFLRALRSTAASPLTSRDYFADAVHGTPGGRDQTLVQALRMALAGLGARFGTTDMHEWLTPRITVRFFADSFADVLFGEPTIMERPNRGSVNLLVELTPEPTSMAIVPPGNSGHIGPDAREPPHLRDQLALYQRFEYRRMPFSRDRLEGPTHETTLDRP